MPRLTATSSAGSGTQAFRFGCREATGTMLRVASGQGHVEKCGQAAADPDGRIVYGASELRATLSLIVPEGLPVVAELSPELADSRGTHAKAICGFCRSVSECEVLDDGAVATRQRFQPVAEITTEGDLIGHRALGVIPQSLAEDIAFQCATHRQAADRERAALLGDR